MPLFTEIEKNNIILLVYTHSVIETLRLLETPRSLSEYTLIIIIIH